MTNLSARNIVQVTFKRKRVFLGVLATCLLLYVALILIQPVKFESSASILIKLNEQSVATPDLVQEEQARAGSSNSTMAEAEINSELLLFKSRDVLASVANKIGVDTLYPKLSARAAKGGVPAVELAVDKLNKDVDVKVNANTNVLLVSLLNISPEVSQRALQALIDAARDKQSSVSNDPRLNFLQDKLKALRKDSDDAEQAILKFREKSHINSLDEERTLLLQQRDNIESELNQVSASLVASQGQHKTILSNMQSTPADIPLSNENDRMQKQVDDAQMRLSSAEAALDAAKLRFADGNPELIDAEAQYQTSKRIFDKLSAAPAGRIRSGTNPLYEKMKEDLSQTSDDIQGDQAALDERKHQLAQVNERLMYLDSNESELRDLEHRRDVADEDFRTYLARLQSARIVTDENDAGISTLGILQSPTLPFKPSKPRKLLMLALALFAGVVGGLGICLGLESMDDRISTSEEVESLLGLPLLASIGLRRPALA